MSLICCLPHGNAPALGALNTPPTFLETILTALFGGMNLQATFFSFVMTLGIVCRYLSSCFELPWGV